MKHLKQLLSTALLLLFLSTIALAQERMVSGTITDAKDGSPIPGASVTIKGVSGKGTVSDMDGKFQLSVAPNAVLVISFVGYEKKEVPADKTTINVTLSEDTKNLSEVMVIGYGTVKKSDATGSVLAVDSKDFNKGAITSPQDLLVGKTAGVVITSNDGSPGAGSTIRVRGGSSLNASNDPLIIIDGVPIDNNGVSGSSNILSFVNPNDIESFTVLKDASATAIYGSRASNGVILITTKKGKAGSPMKVTYDGKVSISTPAKLMDLFSGDQIRQMAYQHENLYGADALNLLGNTNTDWQNEIYRTAVSQDQNISVSGAYKSLPYRASIGYTDQNGILKNTEMKRFTGSVSLDPTFLNNSLKVSINAKGMNTNQNYGDAGAVGSAVSMDPSHPVMDGNPASNGYFQWVNYGASLGTANPVQQLSGIDNKAIVLRGIGNIQLNYANPAIPDLHFNLNLATDYTKSNGHNDEPLNAPVNLTSPSVAGRTDNYDGTNYNNLLDFYLNYAKEIAQINSKLDITAGYSWQHFKRLSDNYSWGYKSYNVDSKTGVYQMMDSISHATENYLVSFFGRLNYTFMGRYLLTATIRDDGSSRFSSANRWGVFPSAALAWKIKDESFLKNVNAISDLKLRVGYGVTGQQDIGNDYPAQAVYTTAQLGSYYMVNGQYIPTLRPATYDPNIKWEQTTTQNIGLDFGFVKDRITGSLEYYKRTTDNLLNTVTIPSGSNFSNTLYTNVGSLENKGVEVTLNLKAISTKDMELTFNFNLTYNQNKITKLNQTDDPNYQILYGSAFTGQNQVTQVGYPGYSFYVNKQVYDASGNPIEGLYVDLSGKGNTVSGNNADKYIYHNPNPDYLMGFAGRFSYKSFDCSFSTRISLGNYVYNGVAAGASYDQMYQIGYWKNFTTALQNTNFISRQFTSDYFVENASFFKLDNINVGYKFDNIYNQIGARVSFSVQNVWTVTKYTGLDPEVNGGIDNTFYPRARTFILGVNFTF